MNRSGLYVSASSCYCDSQTSAKCPKIMFQVIDIVKMDIERSEWAALPEMLASKQLDMVRQLYAEYHVTSAINNREALKTIQAIEKIGFKRFYVRKNFHCSRKERGFPVMRTSCYEVMYMRS